MSVDGGGSIDRALRATLESLVPGVRVHGIAGTGPVDVVSTRWFGGNFVQVTYREPDGRTAEAMLARSDELRLRLDHAGRTRAMEADPERWRLGAEALRIRYAALFDPMLAIATSDIQPLPHQIRAVYGEMLPRTPLRFLLADDPGAGKTIMCGLYIKELMLRGDLARCLIVAPGSLVEQWQDELYEKFGLQFEILTRTMVEATPGPEPIRAEPTAHRPDGPARRTEEWQRGSGGQRLGPRRGRRGAPDVGALLRRRAAADPARTSSANCSGA